MALARTLWFATVALSGATLAADTVTTGTAPPVSSRAEDLSPAPAAAFLPTTAGGRWTYRNVYRSSSAPSNGVITVTWESAIRVHALCPVPEGSMVLRDQHILNVKYDYPAAAPAQDVAWAKTNIPARELGHYLLSSNSVFDVPESDWNAGNASLTDTYRLRFREGQISPLFRFPLDVGRTWSERSREIAEAQMARLFEAGNGPAPNPGMYCWVVEAREDVVVPFGFVRGASRLASRTLGGVRQVWFKDGLGVVKESYRHCGSYFESESVLVSFEGQAVPFSP